MSPAVTGRALFFPNGTIFLLCFVMNVRFFVFDSVYSRCTTGVDRMSSTGRYGVNSSFSEPGEDSLLSIPEQRCGAGPPPGEGAIATDVRIQDVLQCATCHYRHRAGAEDSQTPVRNSDHMAVESRGDLASRHGSIGRFAAAHSWSYRSDNPICTRTPCIYNPRGRLEPRDMQRNPCYLRSTDRPDWSASVRLHNPASSPPSRSMIMSTSCRERHNRSNFQTTITSPGGS